MANNEEHIQPPFYKGSAPFSPNWRFPPLSGRTVRRLRAHFSAQHIHKRRTKLAQHRQQQLYKIWRRQINEQNTHACTSVTHSHSGQIYRHGTGSVHGEKKTWNSKGSNHLYCCCFCCCCCWHFSSYCAHSFITFFRVVNRIFWWYF